MDALLSWYLTPRATRLVVGRSLKYRADIDGIRAIAISLVVVFHAFPRLLPGGFLGVDVFFVISGFLIAGIIFEEVRAGRFRFLRFYRRRVIRLFPALSVVLLSCILVGSLFLTSTEYNQLAKHATAGSFGVANIALWAEAGYFDLPSQAKPLLHLWSLGVEEQFYLFLPISIVALAWINGPILAAMVSVLVMSFLASADLFRSLPAESMFFLPQFRAWELMAGALLAYSSDRIAPGRFRNAAAVAGLSAIAYALFPVSAQFSALGVLIPVSGTVLLIAAGPDAWINRQLLANRWVVFIGAISYPLYLWHWPVICFFGILNPGMGIASRVALVAVSIVLAVLTWLFVERPIRSAALSAKSVTGFLAAAMACISLGAVAIQFEDGKVGWAARDPYADDRQITDEKCAARYWGVEQDGQTLCSDPDPKANPTVALIGDSHAGHLFEGLNEYYKKKHQNVVSFGAAGCVLFIDQPEESCVKLYKSIWDKLDTLDSVKTIVLSGYMAAMWGAHPDYVRNVRTTVEKFAAAGKRVIFMLDVPQLNFDPRICVTRPFQLWMSQLQEKCSIDRAIYDYNIRYYRPNVRAALEGIPNVEIFDLTKVLCDMTVCHAKVQGKVIYFDSNHLNETGSILVAQHYDF